MKYIYIKCNKAICTAMQRKHDISDNL